LIEGHLAAFKDKVQIVERECDLMTGRIQQFLNRFSIRPFHSQNHLGIDDHLIVGIKTEKGNNLRSPVITHTHTIPDLVK
jgi:hypothetical protein